MTTPQAPHSFQPDTTPTRTSITPFPFIPTIEDIPPSIPPPTTFTPTCSTHSIFSPPPKSSINPSPLPFWTENHHSPEHKQPCPSPFIVESTMNQLPSPSQCVKNLFEASEDQNQFPSESISSPAEPSSQTQTIDEITPIFGNDGNIGFSQTEFDIMQRQATERASKYLGKFEFGPERTKTYLLPPPPSFPPRRHDFSCSPEHPPPPYFLDSIKEIINSPPLPMKKPLLSFSTDASAIKRNGFILEQFDHDIPRMMSILAPNTQLATGSEFRPTSILQPLLHRHPNWEEFSKALEKGAVFPMKPVDKEQLEADFQQGLENGNHKGAEKNPELLIQLLSKDIIHGRALPIPLYSAKKIKNGVFSPLNIHDQYSINEFGERVPKPRLTHNQSFPGLSSATSVNSRQIKEEVPPLIYGNMFRRHIHMIHALRQQFPCVPIFQAKFDWDSAYRRIHLSWETAQACICTTIAFALIFFRLTFGGAACPPIWCNGAELTTDLSIDIMNCSEWSPEKAKAKFSEQKTPAPVILDKSIPFKAALPVDVSVNVPRYGTADDYIDDICTLCVGINDYWRRTSEAVLLALYIVARPEDKNDPIPRNPIISLRKWIAEGTPEEVKVILGWEVNTRMMSVSLPECRVSEWSNQIKHMLEKGKAQKATWHKVLGRLTRLSEIIPLSRFFLNRIREATSIAEEKNWCSISKEVKNDLELWLMFLEQSKKGFSINNLVYRSPSNLLWSDSWPGGMGGYSAKGPAWRFEIPQELRCDNVNNILEYLAAFITIWLEIFEGFAPPESCILSCSDSTSAVGWLFRNNFNSFTQPIHEEISRKLAEIMINNECCLYSQHHKGKRNVLADLLSRCFFLDDLTLTNFFKKHFSSQMPSDFQIRQLPTEISSWIISLLQKLKDLKAQQQKPKKAKPSHGEHGAPSYEDLDWEPILSSFISTGVPEQGYSELLELLSEGQNILQETKTRWSEAQSLRPLGKWLRPSKSTMPPILD